MWNGAPLTNDEPASTPIALSSKCPAPGFCSYAGEPSDTDSARQQSLSGVTSWALRRPKAADAAIPLRRNTEAGAQPAVLLFRESQRKLL
jgi:hypothetical protein